MKKNKVIIGLDCSTSVIGITLLDYSTGEIILMQSVNLNKSLKLKSKDPKTTTEILIKKIRVLIDLIKFFEIQFEIKHVFIEDFMKAYSFGRTSKNTLIALAQTNGMAQLAIALLNINCQAIPVSTARKLAIGKIKKTKDQSQKEYVYEWFKDNVSHDIPNIKEARDMVDSWVVAKGGYELLNK